MKNKKGNLFLARERQKLSPSPLHGRQSIHPSSIPANPGGLSKGTCCQPCLCQHAPHAHPRLFALGKEQLMEKPLALFPVAVFRRYCTTLKRSKTHQASGRVNPGAVSCFEGVPGVYLSATTFLAGRPSSWGRGEFSPWLSRCPVRRRWQSCVLAWLQTPHWARRMVSKAPCAAVLSCRGHSKPFLLRSELVWTRGGKSFLS